MHLYSSQYDTFGKQLVEYLVIYAIYVWHSHKNDKFIHTFEIPNSEIIEEFSN